ncbi:anhydro-N-acetylmuramic acid kinase [Wenyingzhuangia aestuarii]|uniref:anhydro-N-acetylmuramic acid kinase n=1 Tax=Wenyingzhuangia aestuarii TaxID=1647582 RepID=UPI00143B83E4|nr:anhydro-N-acetylmuramic acid kinase [Wenyingzhuangia aestuarii]NJB83274.1 anhydro-N-acetylmuramic acid kinase [Wenyingzhuangia aestuarii]
MNHKNKDIIGVMSGTSLDGVDLVYVSFKESNQFKILASETIPYTQVWLESLKEISSIPKGDPRLKKLDIELGVYFSELIIEFIKSNRIQQVDLIASHGHTVHHQPVLGYTLQIGSGKEIYKATGLTTICDFRTQDVKLGGQGAPLVPVGDEILFSEYDYCLNLGGFSNVSFVDDGLRKAYDICPVNIVLNHYARILGLSYDDKGLLSKTGIINHGLLDKLNGLGFYKSTKPKSLGVEFVNQEILPLISKYKMSVVDVLRTFVEHIAIQLSQKITKGSVLVTGGGAYHLFLLERLSVLRSDVNWIVPEAEIVEYKEALIFALLGKLRIEDKVNCLASVTGAKRDHSSGVIYNKS